MPRRFSSRSFVKPTPRTTLWLFIAPVEGVLTATGGTLFTTLNAAGLALRPFTIIRTHMEFLLSSDQAIASEIQVAAWGACVVSDQAVAAGVGSVPTPDTDAGSDFWFAHKWMMNKHEFRTGVGAGRIGTSFSLDSKAMRKVDEGEDIITVGEVDTSTSSGVSLIAAGRMLIKVT